MRNHVMGTWQRIIAAALLFLAGYVASMRFVPTVTAELNAAPTSGHLGLHGLVLLIGYILWFFAILFFVAGAACVLFRKE